MARINREPVLPRTQDLTNWTPRERAAYAWLLDRTASEHLEHTLTELGLDEEATEKIRSAAFVGRVGFTGYIRDLAGYELANEEFGQVMLELGEAEREIEEQDALEGGNR